MCITILKKIVAKSNYGLEVNEFQSYLLIDAIVEELFVITLKIAYASILATMTSIILYCMLLYII